MNQQIEAKKSPEVKPWVRRVVEAAGVSLPADAGGEKRLGWRGFVCHRRGHGGGFYRDFRDGYGMGDG